MPSSHGHITVRRKPKDGSPGVDAVRYWIIPSVSQIKVSQDKLYPETITCEKRKQIGNSVPEATNDGILYFYISYLDGSNTSKIFYGSNGVTASKNMAWIKFVLEVNELEVASETVSIVRDGNDGSVGNWTSYVFKQSDTKPDKPTGSNPIPDGWSDAPTSSGKWWMSKSTIVGSTNEATSWSEPVQVTAEDGVAGPYTDYKFCKNTSKTESPILYINSPDPEGWSDNPPTLNDGEYLWMTKAQKNANGSLKTYWCRAVRISGEKGEPGTNGIGSVIVYRYAFDKPDKPEGASLSPEGWSDTPDKETIQVTHGTNFTLENGYYKSPAISHGGIVKNRLKFTTTIPNQTLAVELYASSEYGFDYVLIGKLDTDGLTRDTNYLDRISGDGTKKVVYLHVATAGSHYVDIAYAKDNSSSTFEDCGRYRIVDPNNCWISIGIVSSSGSVVSWSEPVPFFVDSADTERIYRLMADEIDPATPESDKFIDDYIPPLTKEKHVVGKSYSAGTIVIGSDGKYYECVKSTTTTPGTQSDSSWIVLNGWTDNPSGVTSSFRYEYESIRKKKDGKWGEFSTPVLWNVLPLDGENGEDALSIMVSPQTVVFKKNGQTQAVQVYVDLYKGEARIPYNSAVSGSMVCSQLAGENGLISEGLFGISDTDEDNRFYYGLIYNGNADVNTEIPFTVTYNNAEYPEKIIVRTISDGAQGDDGKQGIQGCVYRRSKYQEGIQYHNDSELESTGIRYIDLIYIMSKDNSIFASHAKWFRCKKTHISSAANAPQLAGSETASWREYWEECNTMEPLYTPLLIADDAVITLLQSNQILIANDEGIVSLGLSGSNSGKKIRIWVGSQTPDDAPFRVDVNGAFVSTKADIQGALTAECLNLKISTNLHSDGPVLANGSICLNANGIILPELPEGTVRSMRVLNPSLSRTEPQNLILKPASENVFISTSLSLLGTTNQNVTLSECGYNGGSYIELIGIRRAGSSITYWLISEMNNGLTSKQLV